MQRVIYGADQELARQNLSEGASKLNLCCFKDLLKLCGVDYVG